MLTVSIHIVTYNSASTIRQCLESVMEQQSVGCRVLVIDNASVDNSVTLVKSMGFDVIRNDVNLGYAAAHNQALARTDSPYVLTLNPDVYLDPFFLHHAVAALEADAQVGAVSGCLLRLDHLSDTPYAIDSAGLFMRRNRRQGLRCEGASIDERPRTQTAIFGPDGAAAVYRRAMLDDIAVNGEVFDEDFFMHKEDVDVCWRAQLRGWRSVFVPDAIAHHVRTFRPGQRASVTADLRFFGVRNRYLLMLKNESRSSFFGDWPWIALYDIAMLAYMLVFERGTLAAFRSVWKLRHKTWSKRKIIQANRKVTWEQLKPWFRARSAQ